MYYVNSREPCVLRLGGDVEVRHTLKTHIQYPLLNDTHDLLSYLIQSQTSGHNTMSATIYEIQYTHTLVKSMRTVAI